MPEGNKSRVLGDGVESNAPAVKLVARTASPAITGSPRLNSGRKVALGFSPQDWLQPHVGATTAT